MTVQGAVVPGWTGLAGFWVTQISCIFVETCRLGFGLALVTGKLAAGGARHHFSIRRFLSAGFIEMMITIFT